MSIESVMPSNHLILCHPLLLPSNFPSIRIFSYEPVLCITWPKDWNFSFNISPFNEYSGLISIWISLQSKGLSKGFANTTVQKLFFLYSPNLTSIQDYLKTIALTRQTFIGKVMSLLFNMLSRLVITFLPRNKHLLISWLQSPSAVILEPQKIKSATGSPSISHDVMGPD